MKKTILFFLLAFLSIYSKAQVCNAYFNYTETALTVSFIDSSYGSGSPNNWTWNFGDGATSTQQNPNHTYVQAGTYTVCLTVFTPFTNCQSTYCDSVVVGNNGNCYASFSHIIDSQNPNKVVFADSSSGGTIDWHWDFGDGSTDSIPSPYHIYSTAGTYTTCLTAMDANACVSTSCDSVVIGNINANCHANFTYTIDFVDNKMIHFYDDSSPLAASAVWNFDDGTIDSVINPVHLFGNSRVYNVCLTTTDSASCTSTVCQQVAIGPVSCSSNFSTMPDTANLLAIHFTDMSYAGTTGWIWDFGDADSSFTQSPAHTYSATGTYNVCLTTFDSTTNCQDTYCKSVVVSDCYASFSSSVDSVNSMMVHFTDNSLGEATSWLWDFDDGTTSTNQNPSHTYSFQAWRWVCLTTNNSQTNCSSHYCAYVYVGAPSSCYEYWELKADSLNPMTIHFTEYSWGSPPSNWVWSFGDGDSSLVQNPSHTYDTAGIYFVCCHISDSLGNCSYSDCYYLNVGNFSYCPASYSYNVVSGGLTTFSYNGTGNPEHYSWDFGQWGTSTQPNPANDFGGPGAYPVCLTISDSTCTNTFCDTVLIAATGQEELLNENFVNIFPNPTKNNLFVKVKSQTTGVVTIKVVNPLGEIIEERIMKTATETIDLSNQPAGLYCIKLENQKSVVYKKVIVCK